MEDQLGQSILGNLDLKGFLKPSKSFPIVEVLTGIWNPEIPMDS